ncbi:HNH endonuclease [Aminobacter aminovorans]|uniref:HNH endonuclease n=1 Tax=Aminobacter aminovorans TaxID=83263 RepID=UPI002857C88D|nr:HNH endonuclease [Aminobacter aminovorans]MDR7225062.1 putative HNH restriction endonuclease [Aminobacter aminovorans]
MKHGSILSDNFPQSRVSSQRKSTPVIRYWAKDRLRIAGQLFPDEVIPGVKVFDEGSVTSVLVNKYERDPAARKECIAHYGVTCAACGLDFGERYGDRGKGFIHVHHRVRVSKLGKSHTVDPIKHLIPVCPNCHAMLHTVQDDMTVEALIELIRTQAALTKPG